MERSRDRILALLKQQGPQRAADLAAALGVTAVAVRQQLARLGEEELVTSEDRAEGVGRPRRYWQLNEAGHATFEDRHENLTVELLTALRKRFGSEGMDALLSDRTRSQVKRYRARMPKAGAALGHHVRALAQVRAEEGYMAVAERDPQGAWLLIENHCPICAAATMCQGLCREELSLFQRVLPKGTRVERSEHILEGARRCVYRIQPRA